MPLPARIPFMLMLLLPNVAAAQDDARVVLSGTVVDAETGEALPGVHVFIAASMKGAVTDEEGRYRLEDVPLGAHRLYLSLLGYEAASEDLHLTAAGAHRFDFRLHPDVLELGGITVEAERDRRWARRLRRFERLFIGESAFADSTRILNPEVLHFEGGFGRLAAHAEAPLIIENRALGYRIQYFLKEFVAAGGVIRYDGEPLFEELTPEGPEQATRWRTNRKRAYQGSLRHFLRTLLNGTHEEAGFLTYIRPTGSVLGIGRERFPLPARRMLSKRDTTEAARTLDFPGHVEILYVHEPEETRYAHRYGTSSWGGAGHQTSWIRLTDGPTRVDYAGEPLDPYGLTVSGYFAFEGVADQVPKEYRP